MVKGRKDIPGRFACDGSLSAQVEATARCARKWKRRLATRARREARSGKIWVPGYGDWCRAAAFMALSRSVAMRDLAM
jgi:hypothetical protein